MSDGSMTPAATPGTRLRLTVEALQPGRRDAGRADELLALLAAADEEFGDAIGPRLVERAAVEAIPVRLRT